MRKTLLLTALLLTLAVSASAADQPASNAPVLNLEGTQSAVTLAKPPSGPCTVSCALDPTITCTSQTGSCSTGGFWGIWWITCDGTTYYCPEF